MCPSTEVTASVRYSSFPLFDECLYKIVYIDPFLYVEVSSNLAAYFELTLASHLLLHGIVSASTNFVK